MPRYFDRSPQEVDPLSWFTGPRLPVIIASAVVVQGITLTILYWRAWSSAPLQLLAIPFFFFACFATAAASRPNRPAFGPSQAALALSLAIIAAIIASFGTAGGHVPVEQWWPAIGVGGCLACLAPYSTVRHILVYSAVATAVTAVLVGFVFIPGDSGWPPIGTIVVGTGPVVIGAVASAVFAHVIVRRTSEYMKADVGFDAARAAPPVYTASESDAVTRLSARVAPFLEAIASAGVITESDRGLAAQLARSLRTQLVDAANRSWLDDLAVESGMKVSDPDRLADQLGEPQRAALRGLIVAALESPVVTADTMLIELRKHTDGATAVGLSLDVDLPEGRRLMLLAPYYLTLKTTVDDLTWDDGRSLKLEFRVPPKLR